MVSRLERIINRFFFSGMGGAIGADTRIEIYETIELLISNQVLLSVAIKELHKIESKDGKKNTTTNAVVLYDCYTALNTGKNLSDALARWVPEQEVQIIRAGERSGDLSSSFKDVINLIISKRKIVSAVVTGATYPIVLIGMVTLLLNQIANNMVPQFARILPVEKWTGPAVVLKFIADWVTGYGMVTLIGLICLFAWIAWSLPNLNKSRFRKYLDKIPPWSIYRMLNGSTFLLNVALMLKAGIRVQEILEIMRKNGSPWLKVRISAALLGINKGDNLGQALHKSGYEFPDPRAVQFLRILAEQNGFDEKLTNFGQRWLDKSVKGVEQASKVMLMVGISIIGTLILLILGGVMGIQQLAQSGLTGN